MKYSREQPRAPVSRNQRWAVDQRRQTRTAIFKNKTWKTVSSEMFSTECKQVNNLRIKRAEQQGELAQDEAETAPTNRALWRASSSEEPRARRVTDLLQLGSSPAGLFPPSKRNSSIHPSDLLSLSDNSSLHCVPCVAQINVSVHSWISLM